MENFYQGKKIFVTGAGGFICSHLVEALALAGANVTALVHYNALGSIGNLQYLAPEVLAKIKIEQGDITDSFQMQKLTQGCDVVFHLAALIGIPYSYIAPSAYVSANISGTLNMLEAARTNKVPKLVITSTSETYGTAIYAPIDEKHPMQGQSPYSATKIGADKLGESYFLSFGLPVCIVRPFNTFGPRQSLRAVIPTAVSQALFNDHIKLGSLDPVRDMLFVKDTARGFMMAAASDATNGEVVNLGTGVGYTIGEIVNMIQEITGTNKEVMEDSQRIRPANSEVFKLICDYSKAERLFGWKPQYTIQQGLAQVVDWMKKSGSTRSGQTYTV